MNVLIYLLALPLAVTTIAAFFALVDFSDKAQALRLVLARLLITLAYSAAAGAEHYFHIGAAFATVAIMHLSAFGFGRLAIARGYWMGERID